MLLTQFYKSPTIRVEHHLSGYVLERSCNRNLGKGECNTYDVVCVDGTIKLSVNGKFVNGISKSSQKSGYICLESEGAEILFRNIRIIELP